MKKLFFLMAMLAVTGFAMSQTEAQRADLRKDVNRERIKRNDVARDMAYGNTRAARADHRAAAAYHREVSRDVRNIHEQQVRRHHRPMVHHRRHHRYHHPVRHRRPIHHRRPA